MAHPFIRPLRTPLPWLRSPRQAPPERREDTACEVELARTGTTILLDPGQSSLEAVGADAFSHDMRAFLEPAKRRFLAAFPIIGTFTGKLSLRTSVFFGS